MKLKYKNLREPILANEKNRVREVVQDFTNGAHSNFFTDPDHSITVQIWMPVYYGVVMQIKWKLYED